MYKKSAFKIKNIKIKINLIGSKKLFCSAVIFTLILTSIVGAVMPVTSLKSTINKEQTASNFSDESKNKQINCNLALDNRDYLLDPFIVNSPSPLYGYQGESSPPAPLDDDTTNPEISNLITPDFVWTDHPGNIGATVNDENLQLVMTNVIDINGTTFEKDTQVWLFADFSGENGSYLVEDFNGNYATINQGSDSQNITYLLLPNLASNDKIYTMAGFKKNDTSQGIQIFLEFNKTTGSLENIGLPQNLSGGDLSIEYINDWIESGRSVIDPMILIYSWQSSNPDTNLTLYDIGNTTYDNPSLGWNTLLSGMYGGFFFANDTADNANMTTFIFPVTPDPYEISGTLFLNGGQTGTIYIGMYYEYPFPMGPPIGLTTIPTPGDFTISVVNGSYYLLAWMDTNGNLTPDVGIDPIGLAINKTYNENPTEIIINGNNFYGADVTLFSDNAPIVSDIPDQAINESETFKTINLDDYVTDVEDPDEDINWTYSGNASLIVSINDSRVATIFTPYDSWNGSETITFTAKDTDGFTGSDDVSFTVQSVYVLEIEAGWNELGWRDIKFNISVDEATNITFIDYIINPHPAAEPPNNALNKFIDIEVEGEWKDIVNPPVFIFIFYTQADLDEVDLTEDQLIGIHYWNITTNKWQIYDNTGVNTSYNKDNYVGFIWASVNHLTPLVPGGNRPPSISISSPSNGETVSEITKITGTASDPDGDNQLQIVQIEIDGGKWIDATGLTKWSYFWDTKSFPDGSWHQINVRAFDNNIFSYYQINVIVDNTPVEPPPPPPPGPPAPPSGDTPPVAVIGGPYYGFINIPLTFDGSGSTGTITSYTWDFGDGTPTVSGVAPTHTYTNEGEHIITLTVEGPGGASTGTTNAIITDKPNLPPNKPTVSGNIIGSINIDYDYTVIATDPDNDNILYIFVWDDSTNDTISPFFANNTAFNTSHNWTSAGIYTIKIYVKDTSNATSERAELTVFIDIGVKFIDDVINGYLIDYQMDGTYDVFHDNDTGKETTVQKQDYNYSIDTNDDGVWDYIYNSVTGMLITIQQEEEEKEDKENIGEFSTGTSILAAIIVLILIILIVYFLKKDYIKKK